MFDQLAVQPRFDRNFQFQSGLESDPNGFGINGFQAPDHTNGAEYARAFSGIDGLNSARKNADGSYSLYRTLGPYEQSVAQANVGPDGQVSIGDWKNEKLRTNTQMITEGAALAALAAGGLGAAGAFGGGAGGMGMGSIGASQMTPQAIEAMASSGGIPGAAGAFESGFAGSGALSGLGGEGALGGTSAAMAAGTPWESGFVGTSASPGLAAGGGGGMGGILNGLGLGGVSNGTLLNLGGNLLSGFMGSNAANKAADAQIAAADRANALGKYMYDTTRADNLPALQARNSGLTGYQNLLKDPSSVTSDPGYQFGLDQGQTAIDRSAASRGGLYSGATLKALQRYGQDYAGTKYDAALNRQGNLAGLGQVGSGTIANAGQNYANQAGQNMLGQGNAQGSAYVGSANAWNGAIGNALSNWQQSDLLKRLVPGYGG